jgi:hypothetical protein
LAFVTYLSGINSDYSTGALDRVYGLFPIL